MTHDIPHLSNGAELAGGKYKIIRFIGAGGFGCTYEAEFPAMGIRVAIKEFYINDFCDRDATGTVSIVSKGKLAFIGKLREKFVREAQNIARLRHNNIVRVSDILEENGTSYYVMDYIAGRSLQQIIDNEGPLPEARAVKYISQVMDALEYVHSKNMLHLDVKPDNIMIDAEGNAILIDFGVSKQYDEVDGHNTSTIMGHTPGYAPPEQSGNRIRQFTPAADIYALGATLYTALTGLIPPSSNDIISGFARLEPLPVGTSQSVRRAIGAMMQPNHAHRPQTIAAVRALLAVGGMENSELKIENTPSDAPDVPVTSVGARPAASASVETETTETEATPPTDAAPVTDATPAFVGSPQVSTEAIGSATEMVNAKPANKKWLFTAVAAVVIAIGLIAIMLLGKRGDTPVESVKPQPAGRADIPAGNVDIPADSVMLACVYKPTGEQRFFDKSEWDTIPNKSDYIQLGVGVNFDGQKFIVARTDAGETMWADNRDNDVPDLPNIDYDHKSAAMRDFDGEGNTNKIINAITTNGIAYPAASLARDYTAALGDSTEWSLPAEGQLWLIYENMRAINDELMQYGMAKIDYTWYWSSTECNSAYAWIVNMYTGSISNYNKNYTYRVRAVAPVLVPAVPAN